MDPRVSVIIPSYNHAQFVGEAIRSVLEQSFSSIEVLVTDDASQDGSVEVIRAFKDPRVKLEMFSANLGLSIAMNEAIKRARGEFISVLDSDDYLLPQTTAKQVSFLENNPNVSAVFGMPKLIDERGAPMNVGYREFAASFVKPFPPRHFWLRHFFFEGNCLCHTTVMIRRSAHNKIGLYDARLWNLQDFDLWVRLCMRHDIYVMKEELTARRIRDANLNLSAPRRDTVLRSMFETFEILRHYRDMPRKLMFEVFASDFEVNGINKSLPAPVLIAELALTCNHAAHQLFGLDTLFQEARNGSDFHRLFKVAGCIDAFNIGRCLDVEVAQKEERDNRLAEVLRQTQEHQRLQLEMAGKITEGEHFRTLLSQQMHELNALRADLLRLSEEGERLRTEFIKQSEQQQQLRAELSQRVIERDHMKAELTRQSEERERMKAELSQQSEERERMKAELTRQSEERERMKAELSEQAEEIGRMRAGLSQHAANQEVVRKELQNSAQLRARAILRANGTAKSAYQLAVQISRLMEFSYQVFKRNQTVRAEWKGRYWFRNLGRQRWKVRAVEMLRSSVLFDNDWYLATYPDVLASKADAAEHYYIRGWLEGRDPSPWFSTSNYLKENPDVAAVSINPLYHYISHGLAEERSKPRIINSAERALIIAIVQSSILFDAEWYVERYPDVVQAAVDPAEHYVDHGWREGRDPGPNFSTSGYIQNNPDVASTGLNPLYHYVCYGEGEGRLLPGAADILSPSILEVVRSSVLFDPQWYLTRYQDVLDAGIDPAQHYVSRGWLEDRDPGPYFSSSLYLRENPDVGLARVNPLYHYISFGQLEGRVRPNSIDFLAKGEKDLEAFSATMETCSLMYISGEPDTPGHFYRILRQVDAAISCGFDATWMRGDEVLHRLAEVSHADVLIIWRARYSEVAQAIDIMRSRGKKIVFDIDDLMIVPDLARQEIIDGIRSRGLSENQVKEHYTDIQQTMTMADACFVTTDELGYYTRLAGKTTFLLPNGFDQSIHDKSRLAMRRWRRAKQDDYIRIGYAAGSRTHQRDLGVAIEAVAKILLHNPSCRFVLFKTPGHHSTTLIDIEEYSVLRGLEDKIEWRNLQPLSELPEEMARFDINIAPLEVDNPFCEAKSELKFVEAALVDVPTVASPTQPFRRVIHHGKNGFLASTSQDWYHSLQALVASAAFRTTVGKQAYVTAMSRFGPLRRAEDVSRTLRQLSGGRAGATAFALNARDSLLQCVDPIVLDSETIFDSDRLLTASVSVIIPLFNYEGYIEEALDSVFAQTLDLLDLIIIDDRSTDDSLKIADAWVRTHAHRFNRVRVIRHLDNYGLGLSRNSGFDAAETAFILPLDADNRLRPRCCEALLQAIKKNSAAYAYATIQSFGDSNRLISNLPYEPQRFTAGNYIDAMALVSKEAWFMVGGYNRMRPAGWEDYDLWCRMAESGLLGEWHPEILADYRVHSASMMQKETLANYQQLMDNFSRSHPWTSLVDKKNVSKRAYPRSLDL
jgi:glycosyltransferase involved in cell wall biosynthesis